MRRGALVLLGILVLCAAGAVAWSRLRVARRPPPPTDARLDELRAERERLQQRFRELVVAQGEKSVADAPRGGLMIGIPTRFTASILEQVVTGLFGETTLTLKNLRIHNEGKVRAKMLISKQTIGAYVLDANIAEVQGVLKPGKPQFTFGRNRVDLVLPVRLAEGTGNADLRFKWDSKGLAANMVCGDVEVTRAIAGGVVPQQYEVRGSFAIRAVGSTIELRPLFPDLAMRIFVDPSDAAWGVVEEVAKSQRKGCEIALSKVDIKTKLGNVLGKGFNVKVPQKIFKPVRLPAGIRQSLELQGVELALQVKPTGATVARDRLWYGADLSLEMRPAASRPGPD
jgi:hypothetical protein